MIERCIAANFDVLALTVDTITGGNRERDLRTGFTSPPRLTLKSLLSFAMHPRWAADHFMHEKFELPQLKDYVKEGSNISISVGDYFNTMRKRIDYLAAYALARPESEQNSSLQ